MPWYSDYDLPEPSDVDLIVHEAIEKLEEYIVDNTKIRLDDIINSAKKWEEKYNKKVQEYKELDKLLSQKRQHIDELEKELEAKRTQLGILPFEVGQEVYFIREDFSGTRKFGCVKCNGKGRVTIVQDGVSYDPICPVCKDSIYRDPIHRESSYHPYKVAKHTIDYIKQEISLNNKTKEPEITTTYVLDGRSIPLEYIRKCLPGGSYANEATIKELSEIAETFNKTMEHKCLAEVGREVPADE